MNFKEKVIVITGGSQGIGKELALQLGRLGGKIIIVARSESNLNKAQEELGSQGIQSLIFRGDCSDYQFCLNLREIVISEFGKIDILINNAAIAITGRLNDSDPSLFHSSQLININGSIFPTKVFLNDLRSSKGSVLFTSSLAGIIGLPNHGIYSATKRAILSYAETIHLEEKENRVFVGVHFPGFTENDVNKQIIHPDGTSTVLPIRSNVKKNSREKTAYCMISQIRKQKLYGFSDLNGKLIFVLYRFFPRLSLKFVYKNRKKFDNH